MLPIDIKEYLFKKDSMHESVMMVKDLGNEEARKEWEESVKEQIGKEAQSSDKHICRVKVMT